MGNLNSNCEVPKDMHSNKFGDEDAVKSISNFEISKDIQDLIIVEEFAGKLETISENLKDTHDTQGGDLSGPKVSKLKSTWTRIMRMDFGLGSAIKAVDVPILGRRVSTHNTNLSIQCDEEKVQRTKWEKMGQNSNDISARVGSPLTESNDTSKLELPKA